MITNFFKVLASSNFFTPVNAPMDSYSTIKTGSKYSESYRVYVTKNNEVVSPFHDIPYKNQKYFTCVNEIPRFEHAKFEICKNEKFNPIKQDIKKGKVRFVKNVFPMFGYPFNYGAIPQTWEDPTHKDSLIDALGDNDPIDVIEVGKRIKETGEVYHAKILGAVGLLDEGEADWKIIVIDSKDELADKLNSVDDINKHMPGLLDCIYKWLREYKIPDEKPLNELAFDGKFLNAKEAIDIIEKTHLNWKELVKSGFKDIEMSNRTIEGSNGYSNSAFTPEGSEGKDAEHSADIYSYYFTSQ